MKDIFSMSSSINGTLSSVNNKKIITSKVMAVVVLYNVSIDKCITLQTLNASLKNAECCMDIVIYDNSPIPSLLNYTYSNLTIIDYFTDTTNSGVSRAYNYALNQCTTLFKTSLLLLDQDTNVAMNFIEVLCMNMVKYPYIKLFAPIIINNQSDYLSPSRQIFGWSRVSKSVNIGINSFKKQSLINSGLLVNVDALLSIGGFNYNLPLDFSDAYIIDKFRALDYEFCLIDSTFNHSLSNEETDIEKIKKRYLIYIKSAKIYRNATNKSLLFSLLVAIRAFKLTLKHASLFFIKNGFIK